MEKKIEVIFGNYMSRRNYDFTNLYDGMLTGSESTAFGSASAMAARGWDTTIYTRVEKETTWKGVKVRDIAKVGEARKPPSVFYAYCDPSDLQFTPSTSLRILNTQIADFNFTSIDNLKYADVLVAISNNHKTHMEEQVPGTKWEVIHNGYDPTLPFRGKEKVNGSTLWASSPDRGLHRLLQIVPTLSKEVKNFSLSIYYDYDHWLVWANSITRDAPRWMQEIKNRAEYVKYALGKMNTGYGITHYKGVSKNKIAEAFARTAVNPYTCEPVKYCETFCNSLLESCVSGCLPITTKIDCLPDVFGSVVPMIDLPISKHLDTFTNLVIRGLTDEKWANLKREECYEFAQNFTFDKQAEKLDQLIERKWKELK